MFARDKDGNRVVHKCGEIFSAFKSFLAQSDWLVRHDPAKNAQTDLRRCDAPKRIAQRPKAYHTYGT